MTLTSNLMTLLCASTLRVLYWDMKIVRVCLMFDCVFIVYEPMRKHRNHDWVVQRHNRRFHCRPHL